MTLKQSSHKDLCKSVVMITSVPGVDFGKIIHVLESLKLSDSNCFVINPSTVLLNPTGKLKHTYRRVKTCCIGENLQEYDNKVDISVNSLLGLLSSNQFFLSHLTPRDIPFYFLPKLKIVFVRQNIILSLMNSFKREYLLDFLSRDDTFKNCERIIELETISKEIERVLNVSGIQNKFHQYLKTVAPLRRDHLIDLLYWKYYKNACFIDFEDLLSSKTLAKSIVNLSNFLDIDVPETRVNCLVDQVTSLQKDTSELLLNIQRGVEDPAWDSTAQEIFESNFLHVIQKRLNHMHS